jgi:acetate kinase
MRVVAALEKYIPLAPLHQPHNLAPIRAARAPAAAAAGRVLRHVVPPRAAACRAGFALPKSITDRGVLRYGFHGLSYEYIAGVCRSTTRARRRQGRRAAPWQRLQHVRDRERPQRREHDGLHRGRWLPMGTRCGSLDPGVVLYLMDELEMDARAIEKLIYQQSGCSACPASPATCARSRRARAAAKAAIDLYVYRIGRELGSLAAALGGVDAIVFHRGHRREQPQSARARLPRCRVARRRARRRSERQGDVTHQHRGKPRVGWVIPTNEELMIARHTRECSRLAPAVLTASTIAFAQP